MPNAESSRASRLDQWLRDNYLTLIVVYLLLALLATAFVFWRFDIGFGYLVVLLIGAFVGVVELVGRYLYAPVRAILTVGGVSYVAVNIVASLAAYYMVGSHGFSIIADDPAAPDAVTLKRILLAGFGALAFMRTSVFNLQVGNSTIGVGPAAILETLLKVADRGVDRREAIYRAREVTTALANVDPIKGATLLTSYCLALMQNVSVDEQVKAKDVLKQIASDEGIDKDVRLDLIALELSKIVGPDVLEAAVAALGARLSGPAAAKSAADAPVAPAEVSVRQEGAIPRRAEAPPAAAAPDLAQEVLGQLEGLRGAEPEPSAGPG